jgi:hypothetical protein
MPEYDQGRRNSRFKNTILSSARKCYGKPTVAVSKFDVSDAKIGKIQSLEIF